jgi:hypothetical protein
MIITIRITKKDRQALRKRGLTNKQIDRAIANANAAGFKAARKKLISNLAEMGASNDCRGIQ